MAVTINGSGSISGVSGIASAWVTFKGDGTVSIYASGNVSSITDNAAGDYRINFSSAFSDTNYTFAGSGMPIDSHGANHPRLISAYRDQQYTTSIRILHHGAQGTTDIIDGKKVYFVAFR